MALVPHCHFIEAATAAPRRQISGAHAMLIRFHRRVALSLAAAILAAASGAHAARPGRSSRPASPSATSRPQLGMEVPGGYGKAYHRVDPRPVQGAGGGVRRRPHRGWRWWASTRWFIRRGAGAGRAAGDPGSNAAFRPEAILIGASHSHSSGPLGMVLPGEYDDASPLVRTLAYEKSTCADAEVSGPGASRQIVAAVCQADQRRAAPRCGVGKGHRGPRWRSIAASG